MAPTFCAAEEGVATFSEPHAAVNAMTDTAVAASEALRQEVFIVNSP